MNTGECPNGSATYVEGVVLMWSSEGYPCTGGLGVVSASGSGSGGASTGEDGCSC